MDDDSREGFASIFDLHSQCSAGRELEPRHVG